jgi:hypothetical protein
MPDVAAQEGGTAQGHCQECRTAEAIAPIEQTLARRALGGRGMHPNYPAAESP